MDPKALRIVVHAGKDTDTGSAELSTISIGYGFHQAWILAVLFGAANIFGIPVGENGLASSPVFLVSIVVNAISLMLIGLFDKKVLFLMVDKRTAVAAAAITALGTLLIIPLATLGGTSVPLIVASGVLTGLGSAVLIVFWGIAFARADFLSIVLNTAIATIVAMMLYVLVLHALPSPWSGVIAATFPFFEALFLWIHTPTPYLKRHDIPIFSPLPLRNVRFGVTLGLPLFLFGLPLGYMREHCAAFALPNIDIMSQTPLLLAAGAATLIVTIAGFASVDEERVDFVARVLIPFVALSLFFLPLTKQYSESVSETVVMAGFMCFEDLIWILMGCYSQRYRISPALIFGIGRGAFASGALCGVFVIPLVERLQIIPPYGGAAIPFLLTVMLLCGFAVLPHDKDIRRAIAQPVSVKNRNADNALVEIEDDGGSSILQSDNTPDETSDSASEEPQGDAVSASVSSQAEEPRPDVPADAVPVPDNSGTSTHDPGKGAKIAKPGRSLFRMKCDRISDRYLLSARESEVLFYLARGFKSSALQEKLFISEGTAKTHIRHIYSKTNVHSQDELMKLVNSEWIE